MAAQSTRWVTGFLLLACAGLSVIVAVELVQGWPVAPTVTAATPVTTNLPTVPEPREFAAPPADQFGATAARPLLSPSRRPYEPLEKPESEAQPSAPEVLVSLQLVGVLLREGRRVALLLPENQGQASRVREGEELAGWMVHRVEQDSVELHHGDRVEVVGIIRGDDTREDQLDAADDGKPEGSGGEVKVDG